MKRLITILTCLLLTLTTTAHSTQDWCYLTRENGLSGESANKIMTDHLGRIWIATSNGVCFYNGAQLTLIPMIGDQSAHDHQGRPYFAQQFVRDICESPTDHSIYISTPDDVWQLASGSDTFKPLHTGLENSSLLCDANHLYIINPNGFYLYHDGKAREVALSGNRNVHCITQRSDGTIWFLTTDALCCYLPQEDRVERQDLTQVFPSDVNFGDLAIVGAYYYVGTKNHGLYVYDRIKRAARHIEGAGNVINKLYADKQGHLCVATDGSGAFLIDGATGEILQHFQSQQHDGGTLLTSALNHYYRDEHGNNWFGQVRNGLAYTYHQSPLFHAYRYGAFTTEGLNVRSFCLDGSRRLIGTDKGLYLMDESSGLFRHYDISQLGGSIITCSCRLGNIYYIGTYDGGLHRIDARTLDMSPASDLNRLAGGAFVKTMKNSPHGELWIGCDAGVMIVDSTGNSRMLTHDNSRLAAGAVFSITFGSDGSVWLGCRHGLSVISPEGKFLTDKQFPKNYFQQENYLIAGLLHKGMAYFGNRNGLFYTDLAMHDFGQVALPPGIMEEGCDAICADTDGRLWVASEKGLFRAAPHWQSLQHFGYGEGLHSMLVSPDGIAQQGDTLWVATTSGLQWTLLKELQQWQEQNIYQVMLYNVMCGGTPIEKSRGKAVNMNHTVTVGWNFLSQTLRTKVLLGDFAKQEGRLYEYRLGDGDSWSLLRHQDELVLERLLPGHHQLTVRLAGAAGTETVYDIRVIPTTLFVIEVLLLLTGIGLLIAWYRYRKNTKVLMRERDQIEDALVEMEHQEALRAEEEDTRTEEMTKYQQLRMSEQECADVVDRMRHYLETNRTYCNPDLKRADLAAVLHVPAAKLSYVFSMYLKENYYEFINRYRLEEFKRLIAEGAYKRFTLTALSEQCGFKKSSFFSTFRKVEGVTPTEYLKRQNINIRL